MSNFNNEVLEQIWQDRYCKNNETLQENYRRVAQYCSKTKEEEDTFYNIMNDRLFYPAGRTMSNSGIGKDLTLNNCFTAPLIEDSLDDIFEKVALGAKTHQKGGGIGYNFSQLRPKGSPTSNDAIASGAVSFMDVFNAQTSTILQGSRRGANMGLMCIYSMDIEDFINAKSYDENKLNHFNVTVLVDDDFINAVKENKNITLHYPVYDNNGFILKDKTKWIYSKEMSAKTLWKKIIHKAYDNGEPGIAFCDTMNRDNNLSYIENITTTNPCFEYLSGTVYGENPKNGTKLNPNEFGGACNLGQLFLHNFVLKPFTSKACIDFEKLKEVITVVVRFLDNIIDINSFPNKIYENYQKNFRTIGLGVTGLADMLCMLNLKYSSKEAQTLVYKLMNFISLNAYKTSVALSREKGEFPFLNRDKFIESNYIQKHIKIDNDWKVIIDDIKRYGIRNAKLLSIAPVGTLSLTYGNNCSSGIEPIFSLSYDRKVKMGGQDENNIKIVPMKDYAFDLWEKIKDDNVVKKDVFVTAMNMNVDEHINMLENIAFHVDMSVSKTINVPTNYSFEETQNIYMKCWEKGIKGCTIFRPNEIRQGILITENDKKTENCLETPQLERGVWKPKAEDTIYYQRKIRIGCGKLKLFIGWSKKEQIIQDIYIQRTGSGGCEKSIQSTVIAMSGMLRLGGNLFNIEKAFEGLGACNSFVNQRAKGVKLNKGASCGTAILNEIKAFLLERQTGQGSASNHIEKSVNSNASVSNENAIQGLMAKCPECGENTLVSEGGCNSCKSCGWSKCS